MYCHELARITEWGVGFVIGWFRDVQCTDSVSLQKKLDKVPVPGKDARLSREVLIEKNKAAEAALEPTLSEIAELEKELEKEKEALREEEKFLEQLTFNAQAEEKFREEKAQMVCSSIFIMTVCRN